MAKNDPANPAPAPAVWQRPKGDVEFEFKDFDSLPDWVDPSWRGFDRGPALNVPAIDYPEEGFEARDQPWTTNTARPGDTVKFWAKKGASPAHFQVVPGHPEDVAELQRAAAEKAGIKKEPLPVPPEPELSDKSKAMQDDLENPDTVRSTKAKKD